MDEVGSAHTPQRDLNKKKSKEMAKIKQLDLQLASVVRYERRKRRETEVIEPDESASEISSSRGAGSARPSRQSGSRPSSSGREMGAAAKDGGETFLTDMLYNKKKTTGRPKNRPPMSSKPARAQSELKPKAKPAEDIRPQSEIDSEEYRDLVFDIEESK